MPLPQTRLSRRSQGGAPTGGWIGTAEAFDPFALVEDGDPWGFDGYPSQEMPAMFTADQLADMAQACAQAMAPGGPGFGALTNPFHYDGPSARGVEPGDLIDAMAVYPPTGECITDAHLVRLTGQSGNPDALKASWAPKLAAMAAAIGALWWVTR